jgi:WD40 repeat protein
LVNTTGGVPLQAETDTFVAVAFPPDPQMLAGVGDNGNVYLWNLDDLAAEPSVLQGHTGQITAVGFSPDGRWLATAGADGKALLWDMLDTSAGPAVLTGHEDKVYALAFSPDGRRLVTASADGTARVWDVQDKSMLKVSQQSGEVRAVTFQGVGDWVTTVSGEHDVIFWHAEWDNNWHESFTQRVNTIAQLGGSMLAVGQGNPDSTRDDINLSIYHMQPGVAFAVKGHEARVTSVSYMPERRVLASASDDATVRLWDMNEWGGNFSEDWKADPVELRSDGATINQLVFAADGSFLAGCGDEDNKIRLWDLNAPTEAPVFLQGHDSAIRDIAFSKNVRWLASVSSDGTIRLWDMDSVFSPRMTDDTGLDDLLVWACEATGRNLTKEEWQQYFQTDPYHQTCEQWPVGE